MRYAFISRESEVRQVITGELSTDQLSIFERDYHTLFGTISAVKIDDDSVRVWIGGTYTPEEGFSPPPPPPQPEIVEGTSEEMSEEIAEEPTNDAA
jgi:hypothetical protein